MCEGGINASQLKYSINQVNDTLALAQEWAEELHQLADQSNRSDSSVELAQVSVILGEAREKLEAAAQSVDGVASSDVTVERL